MKFRVTNIHRRSNGTVDTDIYRRKAFLLRRETTNQPLRRFGRSAGPLIGAIAILVSYALLLPSNLVLQGATSMLAPAKVSPLPDSLGSPSNHRSQ